MGEFEDKARLFRILSHPTRLKILDMLREGEECVCHMQSVLGKRQAYVSQQLIVLRDAGMVTDRKEGLNVFYTLADQAVADMLDAVLGPAGQRAQCDQTACPRCDSSEPAVAESSTRSGSAP